MYYLNSREMTDLEKFVSLCLKKYDLLTGKDLEIIKIIYDKLGRKALMDLAIKEKIVPFVAYTLSKINIEKSFWQKKYNYFRNRNSKIVKFLDIVFKEMNKRNIPIFLYENFGSLLLSGEDIGLFCSGDFDLCTSLAYKKETTEVLKKYAYFPKIRRCKSLNDRTEFCNINNKDNIWINVMWTPLTARIFPVAPKINSEIFFKNIDVIDNLNIKVPSFNNLLFLCLLHTSAHKYICSPGMKLNVDIDRLVITGKIKWEEVIEFAVKYNVKRRVSLSLMLAYDFLNTPIPKDVISKLSGDRPIIKIVYKTLIGDSFLDSKEFKFNYFKFFCLEILLHDSGILIGFFKAIFPDLKWLIKIYDKTGKKNYVKAYISRVKLILFNRKNA